MKAQNVNLSQLTFDYYDPGYTLIGTTATSSYVLTVSPNAMNPGNFRDPTNWAYTVYEERKWKGQMRHWEGVSHYQHRTEGPHSGAAAPFKPTWDRTLVYNRALEKLNSKVRGNLDLAIDIAEARTTGRMVRGLANVLNFARSRRWSTRDLANGWLQFQYGWKPLVQDIFDVADENQRSLRKALTHVKAGATMPIGGTYRGSADIRSVVGPIVGTGNGKQSCRIDLTLDVRGFDPGQWSSLNPVSLAWELIPYSFVVDWFVDVGSYLRNLESALLYSSYFQRGFKSELYVYEGQETAQNNFNGYWYGPDQFGTWRRILWMWRNVRSVQFQRTKLTSYPLPRIPSFKAELGSYRLLSAAALLRQLLK